MAMLPLPADFLGFSRSLAARGAEYLVVGGYAVGWHGYPRSTGDLDVWVSRRDPNPERVAAAIRDFGFDVPDLTADLFREPDRLVRMGNPPLRIEVMTSISGVDFEDCWRERDEAVVDGQTIPLISLRHLRLNKKASGRFKDLADLENLP